MITIVIPISRKQYLDRLFESLNALELGNNEVNLLTYCDGDYSIFSKVRNLTIISKFKERLCVERKKGITSDSNVVRRRQRIADIHNEIRGLINSTNYIFLIEDDTIVPPHALIRLLRHYKYYPNAGIISGIQIGRWGFNMIGAWHVSKLENPKIIWSADKEQGLQKIDTTGMYCGLTKVENYVNHEFKPYQDILGPDFDWGLQMRIKGKFNYVDHDIQCLHMTIKRDIGFDKIDQVKFGYVEGSDKMKLQRV